MGKRYPLRIHARQFQSRSGLVLEPVLIPERNALPADLNKKIGVHLIHCSMLQSIKLGIETTDGKKIYCLIGGLRNFLISNSNSLRAEK